MKEKVVKKKKGLSSIPGEKKKKKKKILKPSQPTETTHETLLKKEKRKTRWEAPPPKQEQSAKQITTLQDETVNLPRRIKDLLDDKKLIVEYLFQIISGAALQELIPDYLKTFTFDELKQLCITQIQSMTDECILKVASGKETFLFEEPDGLGFKKKIDSQTSEEDFEKLTTSLKIVEKTFESEASSDALELCPKSHELLDSAETVDSGDDKGQSPFSVKEIAMDLELPHNDAELLELEMRARAIRSLLKARGDHLEGKLDVIQD